MSRMPRCRSSKERRANTKRKRAVGVDLGVCPTVSTGVARTRKPMISNLLKSLFACVFLLVSASGALGAQEIVTLSTRPNVTQSYFLTSLPQNPQAIAVLFPGSGGLIRLREENGQIKFGQDNFLVRSRKEFIERGVIGAIMDAPSDYQSRGGMSDDFRLGADHL